MGVAGFSQRRWVDRRFIAGRPCGRTSKFPSSEPSAGEESLSRKVEIPRPLPSRGKLFGLRNRALQIIRENKYLLEEWYGYKREAG